MVGVGHKNMKKKNMKKILRIFCLVSLIVLPMIAGAQSLDSLRVILDNIQQQINLLQIRQSWQAAQLVPLGKDSGASLIKPVSLTGDIVSGSTSGSSALPRSPATTTVDIKANGLDNRDPLNPVQVSSSNNVTLTWRGEGDGFLNCLSLGSGPNAAAWSGRSRPLVGALYLTGLLPGLSNFAIQCGGYGPSGYDHVWVNVASSTPPTATSSIHVLYPNGGETWYVGDSRTLRWETTNIPHDGASGLIKQELFPNGGSQPVSTINTGNFDGTSVFRVPDVASGWYRMRMSKYYEPSVYDWSDTPFTIYASTTAATSTCATLINPSATSTRVTSSMALAQFSFDINNATSTPNDCSTIYVSKQPPQALSTYGTAAVSGIPLGFASPPMAGDSPSYYIIPGGLSRHFDYSGFMDNRGGSIGFKELKIVLAYYGIDPSNLRQRWLDPWNSLRTWLYLGN